MLICLILKNVYNMSMFKDYIGANVKCKHIYLCHVDRYIGAYNPHTGEVVGYDTSDKFVPFVTDILNRFPDYSPHNVLNEGIVEIIRQKIKSDYIKSKGLDFSKSER